MMGAVTWFSVDYEAKDAEKSELIKIQRHP